MHGIRKPSDILEILHLICCKNCDDFCLPAPFVYGRVIAKEISALHVEKVKLISGKGSSIF